MDNKIVTLYGLENDNRLLQFLRSKNIDRFSKLDAFCDLIDRMNGQKETKQEEKRTNVSPLCYGQFTGSISELAKYWHWHRATVRSFLDGLESLGVLKRELDGRDYTFQLRTHASIALPYVSVDEVRSIAFFLLHHWDEYSLTPEVLASYFEECHRIELYTHEDPDDKDDVAQFMAETILEAIGHLEFNPTDITPCPEGIVQRVASTLTGPDRWSWTKWMRTLTGLDMALLGTEFPYEVSFDAEELKQDSFFYDCTKKDMALLYDLYNQVKITENSNHRGSANNGSSSPASKENT